MRGITIILPLPPKELHPNTRVHWAVKHRALTTYRADAKLAAMAECMSTKLESPFEEVTVAPVFYFATKRRRDRDNAMASLKAAFDGLEDGGVVVNDCGIIPLPPEMKQDKANPRVELVVTEKRTKQ